METFYEKITDEGKEYWGEDLTVYQDFLNDKKKPKDITYFRDFEPRLKAGEINIQPFDESPIDLAEKAEKAEMAANEEKTWARVELEKLNTEILDSLYDSQPQLKAWRDKLKGHIDNPSQSRPTR